MEGKGKKLTASKNSFLSRLLIYIGALAVILSPAAYRIYTWKKETVRKKMESARAQRKAVPLKKPSLPEMEAPMVRKTQDRFLEGEPSRGSANQIALSMNWENQLEIPQKRTWEELQQARVEFEDRVLKETYATRVRIETPAIVHRPPSASLELAIGSMTGRSGAQSTEQGSSEFTMSSDSAGLQKTTEQTSGKEDLQEENGIESSESEEDPEAAPGYVAFMSSPEGFEQGTDQVMAEIAQQYIQSFPDAPKVTVSLIVGGGVRQRGTFYNDGSGRVQRAGQ